MAPIIPAAAIAAQYFLYPICHPPRLVYPVRDTVVPNLLHISDYSTIPYSFGNKFITISVISYNIFLHTGT